MQSIPRLETDRLQLRAIFPHDAPGVFRLFSDPQVVAFYEFPPFTQLAQAESLIQKFTQWFQRDQAIRWGIFLKQEDPVRNADAGLIGSCCFDTFIPHFQVANLGYNLRSDFWGQGLVHEAIESILDFAFQDGLVQAINRVEARTVPANERSTRVLQRLGFQREGLLRQAGHWKGQFHDLQLFSLLKSDWQRSKSKASI